MNLFYFIFLWFFFWRLGELHHLTRRLWFSSFFLGTAVKYLDIGIVCVLLLAALIFRVDCKIEIFCEISKIKIILITLFTDLKEKKKKVTITLSLYEGEKLLHQK